MRRRVHLASAVVATMWFAAPASAGPPYVSDDPQPTDYGHFEIYAFDQGMVLQHGSNGAFGIDFNYGAAPNLQLTAVFPGAYSSATPGGSAISVGQIELAAKYKFLHQEDVGLDVAIFPRVFLPAGSAEVGERHVSLLLPIWVEKDWGDWSAFGGGGCVLGNGGGSNDYCISGVVLARRIIPELQIGAEIFHQTANAKGGRASTGLGAGATYDLTDNYHLLAYFGPSLQNPSATDRYLWYSAILFTF